MFDPNEIIHCEVYYEMCDYMYMGQDDLPSGIVHVDIQSLPEFIDKIKNNGKKYVVVCSRSDFGLYYQAQHPSWRDMEKWIGMSMTPDFSYKGVNAAPRVDLDKCKESDKYSIKCWSWTSHTFDEIPENIVHLFLTNNGIQGDDRLTSIPFGVNGTDGGRDAVNRLSKLDTTQERRDLLYVNFQFYTVERYRLWEFYRNSDNVTVYQSSRTAEQFYQDLCTHKFVLAPEGNGPDCYRMMECLYAGAIPIMPMSQPLHFYLTNRARCVFSPSLFNLNEKALLDTFNEINKYEWNQDFLKKSYWKNLIEEKRKLL